MDLFLTQNYGPNIQSTEIEVKLDDQTGKYILPDSDILRGKEILGMFTRLKGGDTIKTPITGRDLANDLTIRNAYLTLKSDSTQFIEQHPLEDFVTTSGDRQIRYLLVRGFNPTKSWINVADPTNTVTTGQSFFLTFLYRD